MSYMSVIIVSLQFLVTPPVYANIDLIMAANKGQTAQVRELLEQGAYVNVQDGYGSSALAFAARSGHIDIVEVLLKNGANVNIKNANGETALMAAALSGHIDIVRILLDGGADMNVFSKDGKTALSWATMGNHLNVRKLLLRNRARLKNNYTHSAGKTKGAGHAVTAKNLPEEKRPISAPEITHNRTKRNKTRNKTVDTNQALLNAVKRGGLDTVRILLDGGADVNANDRLGKTPLVWAVRRGRHFNTDDIIKLLLDKGADVNKQDYIGRTPLMLAASRGKADIVQVLIEKGAVINAKDKYGKTALSMAAANDYTHIVELLSTNGARKDSKSTRGTTDVMPTEKVPEKAALPKEDKKIKTVTANGLPGRVKIKPAAYGLSFLNKIYISTGKWQTLPVAMIVAALIIASGQLILVRFKYRNKGKKSSNTIVKNKSGRAALGEGSTTSKAAHTDKSPKGLVTAFAGRRNPVAVAEGNISYAQALLDEAVQVSTDNNKDGYTLLMLASSKGHSDVVQLLLARGADVNIKTDNGITALIISAIQGRAGIVKLLLDNGAHAEVKTKSGVTALDAALLNDHTEIVQLIKDKQRVLMI